MSKENFANVMITVNETNLIALKHSDKFAGDVARFVGLGKPNNFMIIICVGA